jgi:hypothetical protein
MDISQASFYLILSKVDNLNYLDYTSLDLRPTHIIFVPLGQVVGKCDWTCFR